MKAADADVAVIGLGALGASALWRLAVRGVRVLGFEQFEPGHALGCSHGHTRLFRIACPEHPGLAAVAQRSLELWHELGARTRTTLVDLTGGLVIGAPESDLVRSTLAAARAHDLPIRALTASELQRAFPQHAGVPSDHVALWDGSAGVMQAQDAVIAATDAARRAGARVHAHTRVTDVELLDGGVAIRTATRTFRVGQVVVSAGPWLSRLVPGLALETVRAPMTWFAARADDAAFGLRRFPPFVREVDGQLGIWGHGAAGGLGAKIGPARDPSRSLVDPDAIDRNVSAGDWELVAALVARALPGLEPTPVSASTCMITSTADGQFLLGRPRHEARILLAGGCCGHAFKHASGIGEHLAQLACGESPALDVSFADPNRFL